MMLEGNSTYHGELGLGQSDLIETNMILRGVYIIIRLSFLIVKL